MEASEITAILGLASTDPRVEETLRRFGIDERPHVHVDPRDADGPVVETQDWVGNNGAGIEFGFEDEAAFKGLDAFDHGTGPMILTEVYLYGDHPTVRAYRGRLPFGLMLTDDRQTVRIKLVAFEHTRRSYVRDTWEMDAFRMTINYVDKGSRIGFILCFLRYVSLSPFEHGTASLPLIETVIGLFGRRLDDLELRKTFVPLGLDRMERQGGQKLADFRLTYGFELKFSKLAAPAKGSVSSAEVHVLSEIVCYRDREMDALGWRGNLPFGIEFSDSPEMFEGKVGQLPDDRLDEDFTGFAVWHFDAYSLCIYYSTMENLVLRVRILAPGVWMEYEPDV